MVLVALANLVTAPTTSARDSASASGSSFEAQLLDVFIEAGLPVVRASELDRVPDRVERGTALVVEDAPYRSVFGHEARIEFLLLIGTERTLIEAKRQTSPGSVDEKLALVWLNAVANRPAYRFVLVMDGDGVRPHVRRWIEAKAAAEDGFEVLRLEGFKVWLGVQLRAAGIEP